MMLWIVFAILLAATLAMLLWPLLRTPATAAPVRGAYDLAVYRNQLAEVETDVARDLLSPAQADAARLEIQRRMLAVASDARAPTDHRRARTAAAVVIALVLPAGAGLLYASLGNPDLPDRPYAERLKHDPAVILTNAADRYAAELAAHPSAAGYLRLAELAERVRDYDRASDALRRAIGLGSDTAFTWGALGESIALAQGGLTADALAAFAHALELDAREPRSRFYAGMAEAQIGNYRKAVAIWRDLEKDSKPGAPWLPLLSKQIPAIAKLGRFDPDTVAPEPPSAANLKAAAAAMNKMMGR